MGAEVLLLVAAASVAGGLVGLGMVHVALQNRDVPATTQFAWTMGAISVWCFAAAAQNVVMWSFATEAWTLASDPLTVWLFDRLTRVTAAQVAPLILVFMVAYAGHDEWLTPKWLGALWLYPIVYSVLSLTAPLHGYAGPPESVIVVTKNGITAPYVLGGLVETVQVNLAYVAILLAYVVLARLLLRTRRIDGKQVLAIVVAILIPAGTNVAYNLGLGIHPGTDLTSATFVLSGAVVGWALYRYEFLSATPLASDVLVDELPDPVVILDDDDRLQEYNPAAARVFGDALILGRSVTEFAPGLQDRLDANGLYSLQGSTTGDDRTAFYDPQSTTIRDQHDERRGRLIVLRDVTGQTRRQNRLEALQSATQEFISAKTDEEIATLAVDFVEQVLERRAAAVLLADADGDRLDPVAVTEYVEANAAADELVVAPETPFYECYDRQEQRAVHLDDDSPFEHCVVYPLGEHGILVIGSPEDGSFASDDDRFTAILARTTQVALAQVERERELVRSRASVERRNEQIEFFNSVLRHTLRNALLVIQGRAEHLRTYVDAGGEEHLDLIDRWCEDLAELTEEIRAINETVTASETERLDDVDLSATLRERANAFRENYEDANVSIDVPPGVHVQANELLGEVIDTIVVNAIEHNDSDEPSVAVDVVHSERWVQVRVADDGPGMSAEMKESVFERDVTTTQTAHGFGLYFVSVMMNLYSGAVWFEDNEPRGTVAVLEFKTSRSGDADEAKGTSTVP